MKESDRSFKRCYWIKKAIFKSTLGCLLAIAMILTALPQGVYALEENEGISGYAGASSQEKIIEEIRDGEGNILHDESGVPEDVDGLISDMEPEDSSMEAQDQKIADQNGDDALTGEEAFDGMDSDEEENNEASIPGNSLEDNNTSENETEGDGEIIPDFPDENLSESGIEEETVSENSIEGSVSDNEIEEETVSGNDLEECGRDGSFYPGEDASRATFTGKNNGETKTIVYKLTADSKTVLNLVGTINVINYLWDEEGYFVDPSKEEYIVGWNVAIDGVLKAHLTCEQLKNYTVYKGRDYLFTAKIEKKLADNIIIDAIPGVYYCGKQHIIDTGTPLSRKDAKNKAADITLRVREKDSGRSLVFGVDYTVKYKNNKEASMKMDDNNNGEYEQKYNSLNKRPYIIVNGKGGYAGFSAKVYFDIYPYNFGKQTPHVEISGVKTTYSLKKGRISGWKEPKITITHPGLKKKTLKAGRDYETVIYKYETGSWIMQKYYAKPGRPMKPAKDIDAEGKYLYAVRGKGNYCGIFGGQGNMEMNLPFVCDTYTEDSAPWQFKVMNDTKHDLANAKIVIKHPTVDYNFDSFRYYNDVDTAFDISVYYYENKTWQQYPQIAYDTYYVGKPYDYIYGHKDGKAVIRKLENTELGGAMVAGEYKVVVKAKAGNGFNAVGSCTAKTKVKVRGISTNYKKLKKTEFKYNGAPLSASDLEAAYNSAGLPINIIVDPKAAMDNQFESTADSEGIYRSKYLGSIVDFNKIDPRTVCPINTVDDRMPGTYSNEFIAVGAGIDHDKPFIRKYKRVGIKLTEAEKTNNPETGMILFTASANMASAFNVNGTFPSGIKIYFNGYMNYLPQMYYNGQTYPITDAYGNTIDVKIWAYNNKKPGKAYFVVEGDGKVFKGRSSKIYYDISDRVVSYKITVVNSEDWYVDNGKKIPYTLKKGMGYEGNVYAVMSPGKKTNGGLPKKKNIELYQAYFKNASDYSMGKKYLKKIDPKYYSLQFGYTAFNNYTVSVNTGKTHGFNFSSSPTLSDNYTLYDKKVDIKKILVDAPKGYYYLPNSKDVIAEYTGRQIKPTVLEVVLSNGITLSPSDYDVEYGSNINAGNKKGSIKVTLKQNMSDYNFKYGCSKTFYFNIGKKETGLM